MIEYDKLDFQRCLAQIRDIAASVAGLEKPEDIDIALQELALALSQYWCVINLNLDIPTTPLQELTDNLAALSASPGN